VCTSVCVEVVLAMSMLKLLVTGTPTSHLIKLTWEVKKVHPKCGATTHHMGVFGWVGISSTQVSPMQDVLAKSGCCMVIVLVGCSVGLSLTCF
jgi:hypothetical protein